MITDCGNAMEAHRATVEMATTRSTMAGLEEQEMSRRTGVRDHQYQEQPDSRLQSGITRFQSQGIET